MTTRNQNNNYSINVKQTASVSHMYGSEVMWDGTALPFAMSPVIHTQVTHQRRLRTTYVSICVTKSDLRRPHLLAPEALKGQQPAKHSS